MHLKAWLTTAFVPLSSWRTTKTKTVRKVSEEEAALSIVSFTYPNMFSDESLCEKRNQVQQPLKAALFRWQLSMLGLEAIENIHVCVDTPLQPLARRAFAASLEETFPDTVSEAAVFQTCQRLDVVVATKGATTAEESGRLALEATSTMLARQLAAWTAVPPVDDRYAYLSALDAKRPES